MTPKAFIEARAALETEGWKFLAVYAPGIAAYLTSERGCHFSASGIQLDEQESRDHLAVKYWHGGDYDYYTIPLSVLEGLTKSANCGKVTP